MHAAEAANYALVATIVLLAAHVVQLLIQKRRKRAPKVAAPTTQFLQDAAPVLIVFASVTGTSRKLAGRLRDALAKAGRSSIVVDAAKPQLDPWDELLNGDSKDCAVLVSTVHGGLAPEPSRRLLVEELDDVAADHRVGQGALRGRRFAVLGCGSTAYDPARFCTAARVTEKTLRKLGAARVASQRLDDTEETEETYVAWETRVVAAFSRPQVRGEQKPRKIKVEKTHRVSDSSDEEALVRKKSVTDVEDMGVGLGEKEAEKKAKGPKDMVTQSQAKALKKEGYKLIGGHSAVKLCRWTKHQLRGRGGCYKHTFYGITSYQCMEATPSLACANKCVFCWRHHKNPVATCAYIIALRRVRVDLYAIDAAPARQRGGAGSSPLEPDSLVDFHTGRDRVEVEGGRPRDDRRRGGPIARRDDQRVQGRARRARRKVARGAHRQALCSQFSRRTDHVP